MQHNVVLDIWKQVSNCEMTKMHWTLTAAKLQNNKKEKSRIKINNKYEIKTLQLYGFHGIEPMSMS